MEKSVVDGHLILVDLFLNFLILCVLILSSSTAQFVPNPFFFKYESNT